MTEDKEIEKNLKDLDDICDECKEQDESVTQNLILLVLKFVSLAEFLKLFFQSKYGLSAKHSFY